MAKHHPPAVRKLAIPPVRVGSGRLGLLARKLYILRDQPDRPSRHGSGPDILREVTNVSAAQRRDATVIVWDGAS